MSKAVRAFIGILTVTMLLAAACGGDGSDTAGPTDRPETGENAEPPEGAVAVVNGNEITEETFEARYEQVIAIPLVAEQLQGEQGEASKPLLRAQILSQFLVSDILSQAASDDFDIEVTDEEVQARLEEMKEEAGGQEQFDTQLAQGGMTEDLLIEQQLPLELTIEKVEDEVAPDGPEEPPPPAQPGQQPPPTEAELALQEWAVSKFAAAEVVVRSEIGTWDPQSGQVQPPGGGMPTGPQGPGG